MSPAVAVVPGGSKPWPRVATHRPLPGEMPEWRDWLRSQWVWPHGIYALTAALRHEQRTDPHLPGPGDPSAAAKWEHYALGEAEMFYVAEPMCDLLLASARGVPLDVMQSDLVPICSRGLVLFEKPWLGMAIEGTPIQVEALLWGPTELPPITPDDAPDATIHALSVSTYVLDHSGEVGPVWCVLGRSDWPQRVAIGEEPWPMPEAVKQSYVEDRQVVAALWTLLHQEGIARISYPPRAETRRAERYAEKHGQSAESSRVRLVTLRDVEGHRSTRHADGGKEHDHRWPVSGHWRNQPYGPGRSLRRLQYIDPYLKGPEGAPVKVPEVVKVWRR